LRVEEFLIVGLEAVVGSPLTNNAIPWAWLGVAWNGLGQSWAVLATIGWLGDDVTVVSTMSTSAGHRALTEECLWGEEVRWVLRKDSSVSIVGLEV